jgi:hypothetical protein
LSHLSYLSYQGFSREDAIWLETSKTPI